MYEGKVVFEGTTVKGLEVLLRYPTPEDAPALLDYINTLSREQTFILYQGEQLTLEEEIRYVEGQIEAIKAGINVNLLAFSGGVLAGDTEIRLFHGTMRHVGGFGISTAKPFRGQGLGALMMETVMNEATTHLAGLQMITLRVFGHNTVAMNLYQKMGFVEFGRLPGGVHHRGEYVDDVHMVKRIREASVSD